MAFFSRRLPVEFSFIISLAASFLLTSCNIAPQEPAPEQVQADKAPSSQTWRLASSFPSSLLQIGTMGKKVSDEIGLLSDGELIVKFHEPGALAPAFEVFDAVSYGAVEAGWSIAGYWAGREPALQLFASIPFGPAAPEYLAWYDYGGGRALFEAIYARHNIRSLICGLTPPEASGWFKREIHSLDDFKGLKIRFFGLGSAVLEKLGAAPQLIAGGEIYQALELGVIEASEYAMPAVDERMGFDAIAKHYYFPGWHQQSTFYELMINLDLWNGLSSTQKRRIEAACSANIRYGLSEGEALQASALERLEAKGVILHEWSPEILEALEAAWLTVAAEESAKNADFKNAWESLQNFRRHYQIWSKRGYLKAREP